MAIALDTTAHPAGAIIAAATQDHVTSGSTQTTATFSTGGGGRVLVALVFNDAGVVTWPTTLTGGGLTWTLRKSAISTAFPNNSGSAIYTAFAASTLTSQSIAATFANAATGGGPRVSGLYVWALVSSGTAFTSDTAVIGASVSVVQETGSSSTMNTTITPTGTGSWLFGIWGQTDTLTTLTADSNTSAFDASFTAGTNSDSFATGRYKVSGTVATTTAGTPVTFGCTTSEAFQYMVALEIMLPAAAFSLDEDFAPAFRQQPDQSVISVWG